MKEYRLVYDAPAASWWESLPLGNGNLGAMVFGDPLHERIALNEDTLWSGYAKNNNEKEKYPFFERARELTLLGKNAEAQRILEENFTGEWTESYMPLGDLKLDFSGAEKVEKYRRELSLNEAVQRTQYVRGGARYTHECFVSAPDQALVVKISCDRPAIDCDITMTSQLRFSLSGKEGTLFMRGVCPSHVEPDYLVCPQYVFYSEKEEEQGLSFCAALSVRNAGGNAECRGDRISVRGCREVVLRLCAKSNFAGYNVRPCDSPVDCVAEATKLLLAAERKEYAQQLFDHVADFSALFSRTEFEIGQSECGKKSTYSRLQDFQTTREDNSLIELLFHYGKYLLISSSRPGTQATNLQGIWNDRLTPPWSSNYTLNINTEMNYWGAEPLNLSELHEPLLKLTEDLSVSGAEGAREYYNARGFVTHHNCDIWQHTNPVGRKEKGRAVHSYWAMSPGWLCRHLFEHFEYTQDIAFLRNRAYPVLKKACEFYADVLTEDAGELIFCPATSPENQFLLDGNYVCIAKSSAMNASVLRELFANFLKASEILRVSDVFTQEIGEKLKKLQTVKIGQDGRILEWCEPFEEAEAHHRHVSHLYFAYPGDEAFTKKEYTDAVVRSLLGRSNDGTGWSLAWKVCLWARLGYADMTEETLKNQLRLVDGTKQIVDHFSGGSYPNLFCAHPPFQIDGNFGIVAGIAEMLVSCRNGKVYFLSALPASWKDGKLCGVKLKGGFTADLAWKDGKLSHLDLISDCECSFEYVVGGKTATVKLKKGKNTLV